MGSKMNPLTENWMDLLLLKKKIKHKNKVLKRYAFRAKTRLDLMHKKRGLLLNNLRMLIDELPHTKMPAMKYPKTYDGRTLHKNNYWLMHWNKLITMQKMKLLELKREEQKCNERLLQLRKRLRILPNRRRILRRCFEKFNSKLNDPKMFSGSKEHVRLQMDAWKVEVRRIRNSLTHGKVKRLRPIKVHLCKDYIRSFQNFWDYEVTRKKHHIKSKNELAKQNSTELTHKHEQRVRKEMAKKHLKSKLNKPEPYEQPNIENIDLNDMQNTQFNTSKDLTLEPKHELSTLSKQNENVIKVQQDNELSTPSVRPKKSNKLQVKNEFSPYSVQAKKSNTVYNKNVFSAQSGPSRQKGTSLEQTQNSFKKSEFALKQFEDELERLKFDEEIIVKTLSTPDISPVARSSSQATQQQQQQQEQQQQQQQKQQREHQQENRKSDRKSKKKVRGSEKNHNEQLDQNGSAEIVERDAIESLLQLYAGVDIPNSNNIPYVDELKRLMSVPKSQQKLPRGSAKSIEPEERFINIPLTNSQYKYQSIQNMLMHVMQGPNAMDSLEDRSAVVDKVLNHYMWRLLDGVNSDLKASGLSKPDKLKILTELCHKYIDEIVADAIKKGAKVIHVPGNSDETLDNYSFEYFEEPRIRSKTSAQDRSLKEQPSPQNKQKYSFLSYEELNIVTSLDSMVKRAWADIDQRYTSKYIEDIARAHEKYFKSLPKSPLMLAIEEQKRQKTKTELKKAKKERREKAKLKRQKRKENVARLFYAPRQTFRQRQAEEECEKCNECDLCECKANTPDRCIRCGMELPPQPPNSRTDLFLSESLLSACAKASQMPNINSDICHEPKKNLCPKLSCSNINERTQELIQLIKELERCQEEIQIWQTAVRSCSNIEPSTKPW